ncbi:MAG: sulfotransferase [Chitinophagales bacterium]|nr:sulfotransferase [Bacteroidota bacterium]MCB9043832.1 sulfotransferase [Chitinophagales bacterium]
MDKIKNVIILHGPGRSGSTLLNDILSLHPLLYWISTYLNKFPKFSAISTLNRLQDIGWFERFSRYKQDFPRAGEAYGFWHYFFPDFDNPQGVNFSTDALEKCRESILRIKYFTGKERFIFKLTGYARYEVLDALFENPKLIWIDRDPRAVVMSYYKLRWGYEDNLETFSQKTTASLIREYVDMFAAFQRDKEKLKQFDFLQVYYEDFVQNRNDFMQQILDFVHLPPSETFAQKLHSWEIYSGSNKNYTKSLTEEELALLNNLLEPYLQKLDYR